jgi:hypothetical protein
MLPGLTNISEFLLGGIAMGDVVAGLFFLRYWKMTGDRLFLFFAWSFAFGAVSRWILAINVTTTETEPVVYIVRAISYVTILLGIADKNRTSIKKLLSA